MNSTSSKEYNEVDEINCAQQEPAAGNQQAQLHLKSVDSMLSSKLIVTVQISIIVLLKLTITISI